MSEPGELSKHHNIKPPELAIGLAKREKRLEKKMAFQKFFISELLKELTVTGDLADRDFTAYAKKHGEFLESIFFNEALGKKYFWRWMQ